MVIFVLLSSIFADYNQRNDCTTIKKNNGTAGMTIYFENNGNYKKTDMFNLLG